MDHDPALIQFSLADVPERGRAVALREVFGRAVMNLDFTSLTDSPRLEVEVRLLPGVVITSGWNSPHLAVSGHDRSRDSDDVALVWGTRPGKARLVHLGKEVMAGDGSAYLISCADRVTAETRSAVHHLTVRLQRRLLCPLLTDVDAVLMRRVPPDVEALRLLARYLKMLHGNDSSLHPQLAHTAATHIGDLVALALGTGSEATELATGRGLRAARFTAVKTWILARLSNPDLDVSSAATAINASPRYVQRLFEADGTTFSAFVLANRLALAHRTLANPGAGLQNISDIAFASGFGDVSYFDRTFRAAFGETPSEVRQRALRLSS